IAYQILLFKSRFSISLAAWATFQAWGARATAEPGKWSFHQLSMSRSVELGSLLGVAEPRSSGRERLSRDAVPVAPSSSIAIETLLPAGLIVRLVSRETNILPSGDQAVSVSNTRRRLVGIVTNTISLLGRSRSLGRRARLRRSRLFRRCRRVAPSLAIQGSGCPSPVMAPV